jgi:hypothetical protein
MLNHSAKGLSIGVLTGDAGTLGPDSTVVNPCKCMHVARSLSTAIQTPSVTRGCNVQEPTIMGGCNAWATHSTNLMSQQAYADQYGITNTGICTR